jgi:hypothetical protein
MLLLWYYDRLSSGHQRDYWLEYTQFAEIGQARLQEGVHGIPFHLLIYLPYPNESAICS